MKQTQTEQMNASRPFCPNEACKARDKIGQGNLVIQSRQRPPYRCRTCGKPFRAKQGTLLAGLRKPTELLVTVVSGLSYGCPVQALVHAFGVDERTVARWRDRAGKPGEQVHHALVEQGQLDLMQGPADEMRGKGSKMMVWMGLALLGSTRLWLAGTVSLNREKKLTERLRQHVRAWGQPLPAVVVCPDGFGASPNSIRRAFGEKVKEAAGWGRACLRVWSQLPIGTLIKHRVNKRVVEVTRRMAHGTLEPAMSLLTSSGGGAGLTTALIERFNGSATSTYLLTLSEATNNEVCW